MKYTNNQIKNKLLIALTLSLLSSSSYADWGLRLGGNNELKQYDVSKKKYNAQISLEYRGDKFNMGHNGLSYDFSNSDKHAVGLFLTSKNDGFKSNTDKLFNGMSKRKTSIDVGARATINTGVLGDAVVDITRDVNASKGFEVGLKLGGISPHALHWTDKRKFEIAAVGGLRYQSAKVADYYYGVKSSEATTSRKAYKAKSAISPFIGFETQANITKHITFDGGLNISKKAKSIRNSPLTNDKKYQLGANIGVSYWF